MARAMAWLLGGFILLLASLLLITGGVFERYPRLRMGFLENGAAWAPFWLNRMDEHWEKPHFGTEPPDISQGARLAALQFRVRDRAALVVALQAGGIEFASPMKQIIVPPETAMGATIVFE